MLSDYLTQLFQRPGSKAILGIGLLIVTGLTGGVGLLTTVDNGTYGLYGLMGTVVVVAVHIGVAMTLSVPLTGVALGASVVLLLLLRPLRKFPTKFLFF